MPSFTNDDEVRNALVAEATRLGISVEELLDPNLVADHLENSEVLRDALHYGIEKADENDPQAAMHRALLEAWQAKFERN